MYAPSGETVFSGTEFTVVVEGTADLATAPVSWTLLFRVVDRTTGAEMHAATGDQRGIATPVNGAFEYQFTAQMNVPPGPYYVEVAIWDSVTKSDAITSPRLHVEVLKNAPFFGGVQLNARWKVVRSG